MLVTDHGVQVMVSEADGNAMRHRIEITSVKISESLEKVRHLCLFAL